ncbi:MAG: transposase [Candidatus Omnitrophota bacterium]|nr:transposase [Candidatus Omnitrophota bacterium]
MPRVARIVAIGYPHHIIQRGNNRQPVFFDNEDRRFYLELLKKYSMECGNKMHAYCLMDNHVHMLATPQQDNSLARTMQKLSLRFTQYINKKYKRTGRLWECRFYSSVVDREGYLWAVCRYIERNPVRAKIVNKPSQYYWSSANETHKSDIIESIWDKDQKQKYMDYLNSPEDDGQIKDIRKKTYSGRPMGSVEFVNRIAKVLKIDLNVRPVGRPFIN